MVFHGEKRCFAIEIGVEHFDNVGVAERSYGGRFGNESTFKGVGAEETGQVRMGRESFRATILSIKGSLALSDGTHPAFAEQSADDVFSYFFHLSPRIAAQSRKLFIDRVRKILQIKYWKMHGSCAISA